MEHLVNFFRVKRTSNNNYVFYHSNNNYKLHNYPKKINYVIDYKLHTLDNNYIKKLYNDGHIKIINDRNKVIKYNLTKLYFIIKIIILARLITSFIMYNDLCRII